MSSAFSVEKRMAVTKAHLLRSENPMDMIRLEIQKLIQEAEQRGIEWRMVDVTLRIIDSNYLAEVSKQFGR